MRLRAVDEQMSVLKRLDGAAFACSAASSEYRNRADIREAIRPGLLIDGCKVRIS